jgi:hypothetical protein
VEKSPNGSKLILKWPFGQTIALSILLIFIFIGFCESLMRLDSIQNILPIPSVGSTHRQFELHLAQLEQYVEKKGSIDCIILGSSMVYRGIDPEKLSQAYKRYTGEELTCFNFGTFQVTASTAGPLGEILIEKYNPEILIYGTAARDFSTEAGKEAESALMDTAWIQYQMGDFSIEGWLIEHSEAYQIYLAYRNWMNVDFVIPAKIDDYQISEFGFNPRYDVMKNPNATPPLNHQLFEILSNYKISPENLRGLEQIVKLRQQRVQVVIVDMPVPRSTYLYFFDNGKDDYKAYVDQIGSYITDNDALFLKTNFRQNQIIPNDGWADRNHMNEYGASIFSEWLGKQLGVAYLRERSVDPYYVPIPTGKKANEINEKPLLPSSNVTPEPTVTRTITPTSDSTDESTGIPTDDENNLDPDNLILPEWMRRRFDTHLVQINDLASEQGGIDCIVIGSSMVFRGIDPQVFQDAFEMSNDQEVTCFNFGTPQLTAEIAYMLAEVLISEFKPKFLIYGTSARDYSDAAGGEDAELLYQYLDNHLWTQTDYEPIIDSEMMQSSKYGFEPKDGLLQNPFLIPQKSHPFYAQFSDFEISMDHLDGLGRLLELRQQGMDIIVVELPVPINTYGFFYDESSIAKQEFIEPLRDYVESRGGLFLESTFQDPSIIPIDGWADWLHLNHDGAIIFSTWLGEMISQIISMGDIQDN